MASWDGTKVTRYPDSPIEGYPGWLSRDCGCCGGFEWSAGTAAIECGYCSGGGSFAVHRATGTVALYPGGPLRGWKETGPYPIDLRP